jgi:putative phosphoesterase
MALNQPSRVGVLSDTHNSVAHMDIALQMFRTRGVSHLIHCGDVTSPLMLEKFQGFWVWLVRGNNDYDWSGFRSEARRLGNITYCGKDADLTIGEHRVAACHGDDESLLYMLSRSGLHEWVFHGHSHSKCLDEVNRTKVLNPGALGGRHPAGEDRSVAIIDLAVQHAEFVKVAD